MRVIGQSNQYRADWQGGEPDEQQRLASTFFGPLSDPRREQRHRDLRHNDQRGDKRCGLTLAHAGQHSTDERQHGRIGGLKQHRAGGKDQQPAILQESCATMRPLETVGAGGVSAGGTPEINLVGANLAECKERRSGKRDGHEHCPGRL